MIPQSPHTDRGIVWTLETTLVVLLLVLTVVALFQITGVGETESAAAEQRTELAQTADTVPTLLAADDTITKTLLYYNVSADRFKNATYSITDNNHYVSFLSVPAHPAAPVFQYLDQQPVNYNVELQYVSSPGNPGGGSTQSQYLVYQGPPTDNSISRTITTVLRDADSPPGTNCSLVQIHNNTVVNGTNCGTKDYFIDRANDDPDLGSRYNTVIVKITLWPA